MPVDVNKQLRKLPYGMLSKLDLYLEPPSNKDWQALISVMPEGRYSQQQVELMRVRGTTGNNTCTQILMQDLGHLCVTVRELGIYLKKIGNYEALEALDWPNEAIVICTEPEHTTLIEGQELKLRVEAYGYPLPKYQWYKNGREIIGEELRELRLPKGSISDSGTYKCIVSNVVESVTSDEVKVKVVPKQKDRSRYIERPRNVATDKVALLIGNEDYRVSYAQGFQGQGALKHSIADTRTLGSLLHSDEMAFNVLSFANLTRDEMEKAVHEYLHLLSEECYAVFYFAGHGFEVDGKHYLVPVDAPDEWKQEDAVCIQWILEAIWKSRPKLTVILLDMCRVRPENSSKGNFEDYVFPHDLKIVTGFATCSQSESYERVEETNGIYMKYLKRHICRDVRIEDILHDVTTEVEEETKRCRYTDRQRPEYYVKGGGDFSLRDPVVPYGNTSAERWLQAHKLPKREILEFDRGVLVEVRFEHCNWLTNTINIVVGVVDKGKTDHCQAYMCQIPNGLEQHFKQVMALEDYYGDYDTEISIPVPRSRPQQHSVRAQATGAPQRLTEMSDLQRLGAHTLTVRIALETECKGERSTQYRVKGFSAREFGLAQVFQA